LVVFEAGVVVVNIRGVFFEGVPKGYIIGKTGI